MKTGSSYAQLMVVARFSIGISSGKVFNGKELLFVVLTNLEGSLWGERETIIDMPLWTIMYQINKYT